MSERGFGEVMREALAAFSARTEKRRAGNRGRARPGSARRELWKWLRPSSAMVPSSPTALGNTRPRRMSERASMEKRSRKWNRSRNRSGNTAAWRGSSRNGKRAPRRTGLSCPQFHRKGDFNMLLASWLGDQFGSALCWMAFLVGVAVFSRRSSATPTRRSRRPRRRLRLPRRLNTSVASSRSRTPAGGIRPSRHFKRKENDYVVRSIFHYGPHRPDFRIER